MPRKTRSDSSPFDRFQTELDQWLTVENLSYEDTLTRLRGVWPAGERVPSKSALARWADRRRQELVLERIAASAAKAKQVTGAFAENPGDAYTALLGLIGQTAFEMKLKGGESLNMDTLKDLAQLVQVGLVARTAEANLRIKEEDLKLKERRVVLLEKKAADATDTLTDGALSDEQKMARFREIFGIKV
jgi:hypothetical protein